MAAKPPAWSGAAAPVPDGLRRRARRMFRALQRTYPDADCELDHDGAFQLLVATVLSAQSTDRQVNRVTPALFAACPDAAALAAVDRTELEQLIRPTGFYHNKAAALQGLADVLLTDHDGAVPDSIAQLTALPGVGRKTANVVLGHAFGIPGLPTDTHVIRLSRRMGWTTASQPERVESDLTSLFPRTQWTKVSDVLIFHGRRCCAAKRPACGACPVASDCPAFGAGPTDPTEAARLVKTA